VHGKWMPPARSDSTVRQVADVLLEFLVALPFADGPADQTDSFGFSPRGSGEARRSSRSAICGRRRRVEPRHPNEERPGQADAGADLGPLGADRLLDDLDEDLLPLLHRSSILRSSRGFRRGRGRRRRRHLDVGHRLHHVRTLQEGALGGRSRSNAAWMPGRTAVARPCSFCRRGAVPRAVRSAAQRVHRPRRRRCASRWDPR